MDFIIENSDLSADLPGNVDLSAIINDRLLNFLEEKKKEVFKEALKLKGYVFKSDNEFIEFISKNVTAFRYGPEELTIYEINGGMYKSVDEFGSISIKTTVGIPFLIMRDFDITDIKMTKGPDGSYKTIVTINSSFL